ncbi:MAG: hypothetical protein HYU69_01155 [Bacteroidetes bacterium]|nr:hypothetical protein [Bacteroidota bacterium]
MKTPSDELFVLIKGMNAHEKRIFKLNSTKNNIGSQSKTYLRIFDIINRQKKYNEKELILKLKESGGALNFSKSKNYLFKALLDCLAVCHSHSNTSFNLRTLISQAELLFSKGLLKTAMKLIVKARKIALQNESYAYLNIINNIYLNILLSGLYSKDLKKYTEKGIAESINYVDHLKNHLELKNLQMRMFQLCHESQVKGTTDLQEVKKILRSPLLSSPEMAISYPSKISYYNAHYAGALLLGDNSEREYARKKEWLHYLESDKNKLELRAESYLIAISGLTLTLQSNPALPYREEEVGSLYNRTTNYYSGLSSRGKTNHVSITYLHILVNFMSAFLKMGMPSEVLNVMNEIKLHEAYKEGLKETTKILLYNNFFTGYFINKQFREALRWLTKIIHSKSDSWIEIQSDARRFLLMIHYELGNYDLLVSVAKNAKRFMIKNNYYNEFEKAMIDLFVKDLPAAENKKEEAEAFKSLRQKIGALNKKNKQIPALRNFNYIWWLDSKIEDRPFIEIIKMKGETVRS